jgi:tetratricopeptide (TPR) repeat protein
VAKAEGILGGPVWPTASLALLVAAACAVHHDGWTTSAAGCPDQHYEDPADDAWPETAFNCAELSRRQKSSMAAMRAALIYAGRGKAEAVREVLTPFEAQGNPIVLYTLGWADARLMRRELAFEEYRRAFEASGRVMDVRVRANATTLFSFELYNATKFEEAVRILDGLLRDTAGTLPILYERDARLSLARSLDGMGDTPAAAAEFQRLRELLGKIPLNTFELYTDAKLHLERGQLRSADALFEQARAAAKSAARSNEAEAVMGSAEVAVREGNWERAGALLAETREFEPELTGDDRRSLALLNGLAARATGRLEEARDFFEQARGLSPTVNDLWSIEYELGLTLKELGQVDQAQEVLEASIAEVELQRKHLLDPGLESALADSREKPYDALFELLAEAGDPDGALSTLQKSLGGRLDDGVARIASGAGQSADDALQRSAARRRLDEASRTLPTQPGKKNERSARFVAFVTTESHAWSVVHGAGGTHTDHVPLSPKELCALLQSFSQDLSDETATRLGNALFPPETLERLGPRFAIILPACARSFPVTAVRIGKGRLVDRAVVSISPDVSTVASSWTKSHGPALGGALVLADPLADLPSARQEAEWTGRVTGAEVRLGELASAEALEPSGGRLLHFATHTVVDVAGPALVLADQRLSVADILRRRLRADLVVLASCHSGSRLEGTAAETLSTAFLRAGSWAVLATLRSVEDQFASQVVRAFYEAGGLEDPAGALARVQQQLSRTEPPSRWSAFFVAGSPEPLPPQPSTLHRAQALGG